MTLRFLYVDLPTYFLTNIMIVVSLPAICSSTNKVSPNRKCRNIKNWRGRAIGRAGAAHLSRDTPKPRLYRVYVQTSTYRGFVQVGSVRSSDRQ